MTPTLYEWVGGTDAFDNLCVAFYDKAVEDDLLAPLFAKMDPDHAHYVALWLAEVFGGPPEYTEVRGGYPTMMSHHIGLAITEAQRRRWVNLMMDAADAVGLPDDP